MTEARVIADVRAWVDTFVVGMNLCPFARRELVNDRVRFVATAAATAESLVEALLAELEHLDAQPEVETTLLIHPQVLQRFEDYNAFLDVADAVLVETGREGVYQVASFHPDYRFANTQAEDAENYTNRSPYPMLHLLREESVERAVASTADVDAIPERNVALMRQAGREHLAQLRAACLSADAPASDSPSP